MSTAWMIIALDEYDDDGDRLYWSSSEGWTIWFDADTYTHDDLPILHLPQGGAWVPAGR